jgi:hypothetical protein
MLGSAKRTGVFIEVNCIDGEKELHRKEGEHKSQ